MLATSMYHNISTDRRAATIIGANSYAISMGGDKAYTSWLAGQRESDVPADNPAAAAQAATIGRLRSLFNSQGPRSALRDAIREKRPD